jgi:hypothetical protein
MKNFTFRISKPLYEKLHRHLFPGDRDEHGAIIIAGIVETESGIRLLAREVVLAKDGIDYVPGKHGYRALTAGFVAQVSNKCANEKLCYFAVHCHGGSETVGFSDTDLESHKRGYPALLDITHGGPVGALVFAHNAVAGEIWTKQGTFELESMTIIGMNSKTLRPQPIKYVGRLSEVYDRQSLMFGTVGQHRLSEAKVGIIGLGGVGSLVNEYVSRLGVGEIVAVDFDKAEPTNHSRLAGACLWDSLPWFQSSSITLLRAVGKGLARFKVHIAERVAKQANPKVRFHAVVDDVTTQSVANLLRDVDFLFLCADSMQSRLVFNALVHQYLIPGLQIGSKVPVHKETGKVGNIFSAARFVMPFDAGGCLLCNQLIPADKLQEEALSVEERKRQAYVEDDLIKAPSVITLNALGAAAGANQFLFHFLGLFDDANAKLGYWMHYSRENVSRGCECRNSTACVHCGKEKTSGLGRGDRWNLPCKLS